MGTIKVNNDEIWNDYVKTGKVKGFSIEGFFADKIEAQKMKKEEQEADLLLSKITRILKGEEVELEKIELARKVPAIAKDFEKLDAKLKKSESTLDSAYKAYKTKWKDFQDIIKDVSQERKKLENDIKEVAQAAMDLGVSPQNVKGLKESQDLSRKLDGLIKDLPRLYSEPK